MAYLRLRRLVCSALALGLTAFEIYTVGFGVLSPLAQRATLLAVAAVLVFLSHPAANWPERPELGSARRFGAMLWDGAVVAAVLIACIYVVIEEDALADRSGLETRLDLVIAALGPLALLEMVRRVVGLPLFCVALAVLLYAYWGDVILVLLAVGAGLALVQRLAGPKPAIAAAAVLVLLLLVPDVRGLLDPSAHVFRGATHDRLAAYLWLTSEGTFGTIAAIMSQFIFIFLVFAALLDSTGAGRILMDLAFALTGRFRGGPAQAAMAASAMFGMVSGSTMANVVSTGTFTIPLMIRTGFSRVFAGAVEAVASCGGQIVPPIMGAGVFIMAEIIGVPYAYLMLYALIPAALYFASLAGSVYFESLRLGLGRLPDSEIPSGRRQARRGGYLLFPVAVLLAAIVSGETPGLAGLRAVVALLVLVDLVRSLRRTRMEWGATSATVVGVMAFLAMVLAYGPLAAGENTISVPGLGEMTPFRLALFVAGLLAAMVPRLRGLPIVLPMALAVSEGELPSAVASGAAVVVPLALAASAIGLVALAVRDDDERTETVDADAERLARAALSGFEKGARNALPLVAATYVIGMIVGLLVLTALGVRLSILVTDIASTSLFAALALVMLASLIMGMGLPTVAAYLLLVIVVAPSMEELGAPLVAAHMFVFYYGVLSSITPPVALAAYGASGISGADATRTAFSACRLAVSAFVVPFLFVYHPELLLLEGSTFDVVYRLATAGAGIMLLSMATTGFSLATVGPVARLLLLGAAVLLFLEQPWLNAIGLAAGAGQMAFQELTRRQERLPESGS